VSPALKFNCPLSQIDQNFHSDEPKPLTRRPVVIGPRKMVDWHGKSCPVVGTLPPFPHTSRTYDILFNLSQARYPCAHGFETQVGHVDRLIPRC
jgi:hypothetical protein